MSIVKAFRFPVRVRWEGDRRTSAHARDKETLQVVTPPEFAGGIDGQWSPEELLVSATASCYVLTVTALAAKRELPLDDVQVSATGHLSRRDDGRFGFVAIELDAEVFAPTHAIREARRVAEEAEGRCIVALALDVPVHVTVIARPSVKTEHFLGTGVAS